MIRNVIFVFLLMALFSCGKNQKVNTTSNRVEVKSSALTYNVDGVEVTDTIDPRYKFIFESYIKAPVSNETVYDGIIQATGISLIDKNTMAIIYNTKDNVVEGGLDIVDISDLKSPVILKHIVLPHLEFADSKLIGTKLYLTGVSEDNGAALVTVDVSNKLNPQIVDTKILASYYATSISALDNTLYVTTGDSNGYVYKFELPSSGIPQEIFKDSYPRNLLFVKHYKNGYAVLYDENDNNTYIGYKNLINNTFTKIKVSSHLVSPARFDIDGSLAFINTADNSKIEVVDLDNMQKITNIDSAGRGNGIQVKDDLMFLAQGLEGFKLVDIQDLSMPKNLGKFDFNDNGAGNNVWTFFDEHETKRIVVLSDGLGGVKILSQAKNTSIPSTSCSYATNVVAYNPVGAIAIDRKDSSKSLGQPQGDTNPIINFTSLGFGGSIILSFDKPITNIPGKKDLMVYETTWNNQTYSQYPEEADVYASNSLTCGGWTYLGRVKNHNGNESLGQVDLGSLKSAKYIKIVDKTDKTKLPGTDGFDLDAIKCINQPSKTISGKDFDILWKDGKTKKLYQLFIDESNKTVENYSILDSQYTNSHIARSNNGVYLYEFLADGTKMAVYNLMTKEYIAAPTLSSSSTSLTQAVVAPDNSYLVANPSNDTLYKLPVYITGGFIPVGKIYTNECGYLDIKGADLAYFGTQLYVATQAKGGKIYKVSFNQSKNRYEGILVFNKIGVISGLAIYKDSSDNKVKFLVSLLNSSKMKLLYDNKRIDLKLKGELLQSSSSGDLAARNKF